MTKREDLVRNLQIICDKINADLVKSGAKYDYNWLLNDTLNALHAGESKTELRSRFGQIGSTYFGKGEQMGGYIQAEVVTANEANNFRSAMRDYLLSDEDVKVPII
jgi:hypothetical protein